MSPNEYLINRQTCQGIQECPDLGINKWRLRLRTFRLSVGTRCVHSFRPFAFLGVSLPRALHVGDSRGGRVCFPSRWPSHRGPGPLGGPPQEARRLRNMKDRPLSYSVSIPGKAMQPIPRTGGTLPMPAPRPWIDAVDATDGNTLLMSAPHPKKKLSY